MYAIHHTDSLIVNATLEIQYEPGYACADISRPRSVDVFLQWRHPKLVSIILETGGTDPA